MPRLIIPALVALVVSGPVWASAAPLYVCVSKKILQLDNDGVLRVTNWAKLINQDWNRKITFDEETGLLRSGLHSYTMKVVQKGTTGNGSVAVGQKKGTVSQSMIRIQTFIKGMPFIYLRGDIVFTGTCERM